MQRLNMSAFPIKFTWEVTERCNLDCKICYSNNSYSNSLKELSYDECLRVVDKLVSLGVIYIFIDGGAPLLSEYFFDLLNVCTSKFCTMLSTNATLISNSEAIRIAKSKLKTVFVSLHSHDSSIHDSYTQTIGSFDDTVNGIKCLVDAKVDTMASIVLNKANIETVRDYLLFCKDLKLSKVNILRGYPIGRNCEVGKMLRLTSCDYKEIIPQIEDICKQIDMKLGHSFGVKNHNCCAQAISLSADGNLRNCPYLRIQGSLGAFLDSEPVDLWNSSKSQMVRSSFYTNDAYCNTCSQHNSCKGGCPADKLLDYGRCVGKDPLCWL